jgi:hypothetical protein
MGKSCQEFEKPGSRSPRFDIALSRTESLDVSAFRRALVAWREFIQSNPDPDIKREVDI